MCWFVWHSEVLSLFILSKKTFITHLKIKQQQRNKEKNKLLCVPQRETPVRPLHQRFSSRKKILDHTPSSSLDLGTVLQPNIANAIKVRSPSEKDLCKCDRYVLTHQEVDSDGEIRTRLIKVRKLCKDSHLLSISQIFKVTGFEFVISKKSSMLRFVFGGWGAGNPRRWTGHPVYWHRDAETGSHPVQR